jgi:hypothetical protein
MVLKLWETIFQYFSEKPYWATIRPFFTLLSLYIITVVLAYQYIEWQYHISPEIPLYLRSYIFKQITIVFIAIAVISSLFKLQSRGKEATRQINLLTVIQQYSGIILRRAVVLGFVFALTIPMLMHFSPNKASHIRVKFLTETEPDFDKFAFVYLLYELNKLQKHWYFQVDFDVFDERRLTSIQRKACTEDPKILCYAETISDDKPFIGITKQELGNDFFWQNRNKVSVISTYAWELYSPPSVYEYLAHSIIVQSILIHLNAHCKGLPDKAFKESRVAHGDLFQFLPRRTAIKANILAAHLNRKGEELLLNCFGAEYMSVCSKLLTLEWLHSERITENLEKSFDVKLS